MDFHAGKNEFTRSRPAAGYRRFLYGRQLPGPERCVANDDDGTLGGGAKKSVRSFGSAAGARGRRRKQTHEARLEFNQLGLVLTRNQGDADIILELRHDVLTKYVYSAVDTRTRTVIAGGKVSSLGGTVAGKVAKRFLKQLAQGHP